MGSENLALKLENEIIKRRAAELKLKSMLEERNILMREICHRVRNNFQIFSSLLNLQLSKLKDKQSQKVFRNLSERVSMMAAIHNVMYEEKDFLKIPFSISISKVVRYIRTVYKKSGERISIDINSDNIFLNIDDAINLSLIICELVSNSIRHAFPSGKKGVIKILFRKEKNYILTVEDNGIGLPGSLKPERVKSIGLRLVASMVKDLKGDLKFINNGGVKCIIVYDNNPNIKGSLPNIIFKTLCGSFTQFYESEYNQEED